MNLSSVVVNIRFPLAASSFSFRGNAWFWNSSTFGIGVAVLLPWSGVVCTRNALGESPKQVAKAHIHFTTQNMDERAVLKRRQIEKRRDGVHMRAHTVVSTLSVCEAGGQRFFSERYRELSLTDVEWSIPATDGPVC